MVAYSDLNLKPSEFWNDLNPRDFLKMCEGFNLRYRREYGLKLEEMKLIRWVGSLLYNVNVKKQYQKQPNKLYPLPDLNEEEKEVKPIDRKRIEELFKMPMPRKLDDMDIMKAIQDNSRKRILEKRK